MEPSRALEDVHRDLADEHRRVVDLAARIRLEQQVSALPRLLDELHRLLVDHFSHEQFPGGLYERMGARSPRFYDDLRELVREHCVILSEARALLERSRMAMNGETEAALMEQVHGLLEMLAEHERKEHRLAQRLKREE